MINQQLAHTFKPFTLCFANGHRQRFEKPAVMGILNLSSNSFFNPLPDFDSALRVAEEMVRAGADFLDVGGEATNPHIDALQASTQQEIDRILPLIEAIRARFPVWISVDTRFPAVMRAALDVGVDLINDQSGLAHAESRAFVIRTQTPVCLMHGLLPPRVPGSSTLEALLEQVCQDLKKSAESLMTAGLDRDKILIDPGFGQGHYGKNTSENFYLLRHLSQIAALGFPVLAGWSRKSMIGDVLGVPVEDRLFGSIAAALWAVEQGARVVRVHDVEPTVQALKVWFF